MDLLANAGAGEALLVFFWRGRPFSCATTAPLHRVPFCARRAKRPTGGPGVARLWRWDLHCGECDPLDHFNHLFGHGDRVCALCIVLGSRGTKMMSAAVRGGRGKQSIGNLSIPCNTQLIPTRLSQQPRSP